MSGKSNRTISIASDDRGRIPFAMIGVLMLVTSSTVVFYLDTQPEPKPDGNTGIAMDRASASAQSAVSDGVKEALQKAAAKPLNRTADTPVGRAIDDSNTVIDGPDPMYEKFGPYVRLRIYLETQRNLQGTTQQIDNKTVSRASLPRLSYTEEDIETAISKVDLKVGRYHDDMDNGTVKATVEGINVSVVRNGTEVANRTETMNVTTGTTVFALHEKTQTYEDRLNAGFFDSSLTNLKGFGQKFAARLYPLAWAKAYTERLHPASKPSPVATDSSKFAFHSIVENYEAETLANSAIFSIQKEVYGATDPKKEQVMRGSWICTGAKTIEKLANAQGSSRSSDRNNGETDSSAAGSDTTSSDTSFNSGSYNFNFDSSTVCSATRYMFGGVEGEPPTEIGDFVNAFIGGANSPLNQDERIHIGMFADPAYQSVTGGSMPDLDGYAPDNFDSDEASEEASEATDNESVDDDYGSDGDEPDYDFKSETQIQNIIDETYQVDVSAGQENVRESGRLPDPDEPDHDSGWSEDGDLDLTVTDTTKTVTHDELPSGDAGPRLHAIHITVENKYDGEQRWERSETTCTGEGENRTCDTDTYHDDTSDTSTKTFETTIVIEGTYDPGHDVNDNGVTDLYSDENAPAGTGTENLAPALDESVDQLISGVDASDVNGDVKDIINEDNLEDSSDLRSQINTNLNSDTTIQRRTLLDGQNDQLKGWLEDELEDDHDEVKSDIGIVNVSRRNLMTGDNPLQGMRDQLDKDRRIYGTDETSSYQTPAHHARAELIRAYLDNTTDWMDKYVEKRNSGTDQINSQIGDDVNNGLDKSLGFAQDFLSRDLSPNRADVGNSSLLSDDIRYEIDASPTLLSRSPITRTTTPEVRPSYAGVEDPVNADHAPLAIRNNAWLPVPGLPVVPWPTYWYASVNVVGVQVDGEYASFEVSANTSSSPTDLSTSYVRQEQPVTVEINDRERRAGKVTPINFESKTDVVIATPGATVYPRGSLGPGDRYGGSGHKLAECTSAWGAVGTNFDPIDVNYGDCGNMADPSSNTAMFLDVVDTAEEASRGQVSELVEEEEEDEEEGAVEECDEDTLTSELDSDGQDRFEELSDDEEDVVVEEYYCALELKQPGYEESFVEFFNHDEAGDSWKEVILEENIGYSEVKRTIYMVGESASTDTDESLIETHELRMFKQASETNENEGGSPSHKEPGIVTHMTTNADAEYARVYGSEPNYPTGRFIAHQSDIEGYDRKTLIEKLALYDDELNPDGDGWGDYRCIASVETPDDAEITVSTVGPYTPETFENNGMNYDEDLLRAKYGGGLGGGAIQIHLNNSFNPDPGEEETEFEARHFTLLGEIETVNEVDIEQRESNIESGSASVSEKCAL